MPEVDRVRHVLKGIAEEAVHLFVLQPPADVNSIRSLCQSLEAARRQRISNTDTLPTSKAAISPLPQGDLLHNIIRTIIREELARYFGPLPTLNTSPTAELRTIIRDELTQVARPSFATPVSSTPQPPAYEEIRQPPLAPTPNQGSSHIPQVAAFTSTNYERPSSFRTYTTPNTRPTCFYCGIPGHVARFCRRRQADENATWQSRPSYERHYNSQSSQTWPKRYYFNRNYNDDYQRPDSPPRYERPRSPSPRRRHRSISPMIPARHRSSSRPEN